MSRGVLIFAFNNDKIDYLKQANWVADRVNRYMNTPVTIVTDEKSINGRSFEHNLVLTDAISGGLRNFNHKTNDKVDQWYNVNRFQAYELSPYDETIVIDSDYVVSSDQLLNLFENPHDVLCHRDVYDVTGLGKFRWYKHFGRYEMPHYWATVLFFRKGDFAKMFFDVMSMVKENYRHYGFIHKFSTGMYRNDFAVSIALSIVYGHNLNSIPTIPWNLPSLYDDVDVEELEHDKFMLRYASRDSKGNAKLHRSLLQGSDFHCINKFTLEKLVNA